MGLISKVATGVDSLSNKAGNAVYNHTLKKVATAEALNKSSQAVIAKAVSDASMGAAKKADFVYGLTQAGIYGAGVGGAVGLINNAGNDTLSGTLGGTGLGAVGGAGVGAVAAAIARGLR